MALHFEELWERCEAFFKESSSNTQTQSILDELALKFNLYKAIEANASIPDDERKKVKSRLLGEILLTLTHLSLQEDVNVYEALAVALQSRNIEYLNQKHPV